MDDFRKFLFPMLRTGYGFVDHKDMIQKAISYVDQFLNFTEKQAEYLQKAKNGEYHPELIFGKTTADRIKDNPAAKFYILRQTKTMNQEKNDLQKSLQNKYKGKEIDIRSKSNLETNGKPSGELIHFIVEGKRKTCVTDKEFGDICICDGFYSPGSFHWPSWKTIDGKPATYTPTRVMSVEHFKKMKI